MKKNVFARGSLALGTLTAMMALQARADAVAPGPPDRPAFGLMGLVAGQTARINVVNPGGRQVPPDPCRLRLAFVDGADGTLAAVDRIVAPDQSVHLDLDADRLTRTGAGSVAVRPVVAAIGNPDFRPGDAAVGNPDFRPGVCVVTLEVFDNASGVTTLLSSPELVSARPGFERSCPPGPPIAPVFGQFAIVAGQKVRLNAVHPGSERGIPPGPCRGDLSFVDETGARLAGVSFIATADRAASFEFSASNPTGANGGASGGRVTIRPVVSAVGNPDFMPSGACIYTVEVTNAATGATTLFSPATSAVP